MPGKITELGALAGAALAANDLFEIADVSAGTSGSKSITATELLTGLGLIGPFVVQGSTSAIQTTITTVESGIRKGGQISWKGKANDMVARLGQYDYGWEFHFERGSATAPDASYVEFAVPAAFSIRGSLIGTDPYFFLRDRNDSLDLCLRMNLPDRYGEISVGNVGGGNVPVPGVAALGLKFGVAKDVGGTYVTTFPFIMPGDGAVPYFQAPGITLGLRGTSSSVNPGLVLNNSSVDIFSVASNGGTGLSWLNSFDGIAFGTGSAIHASNERMRITLAGLVGIGGTPDAAALLDVASTTLGFLPPRMTTAQRDAIASPPVGLCIMNSTTGKLNVRGAAAWEAVTSA